MDHDPALPADADGAITLEAIRTRQQLAAALRVLHIRADEPSLRTLANRVIPGQAALGRTTVSEMLNGRKLPSKAVLTSFVLACGETDPTGWQRARNRVRLAELHTSPPPPPLDTSEPPSGTIDIERWRIVAQVAEELACIGRYDLACTLQTQIHHAFATHHGPEHLKTLVTRHDLADLTGKAGDPAAARDQFAALLPVYERVLGAEHPDTLRTRYDLAYLTGKAGDPAAARDQFAALLPVRERVLGAEHPDTLRTRYDLADLTGKAGDPAAARDQFAALLPVRERVLGAEHPDTLTTRHYIAYWTREAGDAAAARDQYAALLHVGERVLGAEHPDTLTIRYDLAYLTGKAGDPAAARDQFAALLPVRERVLGAEHPDTLTTRLQLAFWKKTARRRNYR
ncbi:tetratricopeptide repeat protein [Sphaerisporangium sp. NPDC005288]|uniref:tetratricopeptide repeat protein n=1 Tax=Sphaerisporangium sp. NPDC005288 TaxID=3155114 RepID=UPI0033A52548